MEHQEARKDTMTASYKQLALHELAVGMVLSDDLRDNNGIVLLSQGVTLTEAMLAALRRHGVETAPILCDASPAAHQDADQQQRIERLHHLFRKENTDDASGLLHQYVAYFRLDMPS
jgi:hypothetical protein